MAKTPRSRRHTGSTLGEAAPGDLLAGRPDHFADPGAGLLIQRPGHIALPGPAVRFDLLQDHPPETREYGGSNNGQQHGFRFLRHKHMLLTGHRGDHSVVAGHTA